MRKNVFKEINTYFNSNLKLPKTPSTETNDQVLLRNAVVGAEKYDLLDSIYFRTYGDNYRKISVNVKNNYFNKLYKYVEKIDLNQVEELSKVVVELDKKIVFSNLTKILLYFQNLEEYEKCAVIKKVLDLL